MTRLFLVVSITVMCSFAAYSQESLERAMQPAKINTDLVNPIFSTVNLANVLLPSLETLYESARNSPTVEYYSYRREEEAGELKTEKRRWLEFFTLVGSYQYGIFAIQQDMPTAGQNYYRITNTSAQNWWTVGATVSVPLNKLFDLRNNKHKQLMRMQQTEMEIEKWYDEQRLRIVQEYTMAQQYLALLKVKSEAATVATAQYKISELDFMNGKADAAALSRQKSMQTNAITELEQLKASLYSTLLRLEILASIKIINRDEQ